MTGLIGNIRIRPLPYFFTLVFAISWGGVLLVVARKFGFPVRSGDFTRMIGPGVACMLLGPFVSGLLFPWLVAGRSGISELAMRLRRFRVQLKWYLIALLVAPAAMLLSQLVLLPFSPVFLPRLFGTDNPGQVWLFALLAGLSAGIFEEIGWTGFAIPRLRMHSTLLMTGLKMGFLWGAWHYIVNFLGSGDEFGHLDLRVLSSALFWSLAILPIFRVLMVWVYEQTNSLPIAMLMHASLTGSMLLFNPADNQLDLIRDVIFALILVGVGACLMRAWPATHN